MESIHYVGYGLFATVTAIIAAKWALELGFSQLRQLLWAIVGLVCPPLAVLDLYVRMVRQQQKEHKPAGSWR
jgi:hypothetical protein